jgi:ribonuclease HI
MPADEKIGFASNNIAEFCAIAYGMEYIHRNSLNLPLYSDSKLCIHWVKAKSGCRTNIFRDYPQTATENPSLARTILEAEEIVFSISCDLRFW